MKVLGTQEYNIFSAIWENLQFKRVRKLRFAECDKCNRFTPYRLMNINNSLVICKKCANPISILDNFPRITWYHKLKHN
jgi:hypothetical protein